MRVRKIAKATISYVMPAYLPARPSASPRGKTRLPLSRFSPDFISEYIFKICEENSNIIKS